MKDDRVLEIANQAAIDWLNGRGEYAGLRDAIESAIRTALAEENAWQPIETAPPDCDVLLLWWDTWPELGWKAKVGFAHCTRGGWRDGCATHWQPLPQPPENSHE